MAVTFTKGTTATLPQTIRTGLPFSAVGDFNGDGVQDLVVSQAHPAGANPRVYDGTQSGTLLFLSFASGLPVDITSQVLAGGLPQIVVPSSLNVHDYNGDGRPDVFIGDTGPDFDPFPGGQQHLLLSGPDGRLVISSQSLGPDTFAHSATAADIDGDGDIDVYVGGNNSKAGPYLLINDGQSNFTRNLDRLPSWLTEAGNAGGYQWSFDGSRFIDANQDGFLDLALLPKFTNERPLLLLNDRHGSFDNVAPVPLPSGLFGPGSIVSSPDGGYISKGTVNFTNAVADLNKDGFPDLILGQANWDDSTGASYSSGRLQILINNQGAGFTDETAIRLVDMPLPATNGTNYFNPLVADLNGDGWSDLVVTVITDYAQQSSRVFINDKTGRLVQDNSFPSTGLLLPIDTNADGLIDLVSLDYRTIGSSQEGFGIFAPQIVIYQNQGEPSPTPPVVTLPDSPVVTPQPSVTVTTAVSMTLPEGSYNLVAEGTGNISLIGNALNNIIVGNKGKNAINGGAGADRVNGGLGNDNLMGGSGKDAFVFSTKLGTSKTDRTVNFDTIKDFAAKDDSLYLDNAILKKLGKKGSEKTPAKLDKKFFVVGDKAKDKDDYIVYNKKTGVLSYDADGSGTRQAVEFALLKNKAALKYDDFFVI